MTLYNMRQGRDEPIRAFCARLRGQAALCNLNVKCQGCRGYVSYAEDAVGNGIYVGLADLDVQRDLFSDENQARTVPELLRPEKREDLPHPSWPSPRPLSPSIAATNGSRNQCKGTTPPRTTFAPTVAARDTAETPRRGSVDANALGAPPSL